MRMSYSIFPDDIWQEILYLVLEFYFQQWDSRCVPPLGPWHVCSQWRQILSRMPERRSNLIFDLTGYYFTPPPSGLFAGVREDLIRAGQRPLRIWLSDRLRPIAPNDNIDIVRELIVCFAKNLQTLNLDLRATQMTNLLALPRGCLDELRTMHLHCIGEDYQLAYEDVEVNTYWTPKSVTAFTYESKLQILCLRNVEPDLVLRALARPKFDFYRCEGDFPNPRWSL